MTVAVVNHSTSTLDTAGTTLTATIGWTPVAGNLLILFVGHNNTDSFAVPGWFQLAQASAVAANRCALFAKVAVGGDSSPVASWTTSSKAAAHVAELSGADTTVVTQGLSAEQWATNGVAANGTALSVGPTGTLTANGRAYAVVEWFDRETTPSWNNSFVDAGSAATTTPSASSLTVGAKAVTSGTTATCQTTVATGTSRHGLLVVFYEPGPQALEATVVGSSTVSADVSGVFPLAAGIVATATVAADLTVQGPASAAPPGRGTFRETASATFKE